ncbi:LPXTG cell wall anchor domain-containing protein [Shimazuella kribbensis]|uniref:LPXTG cell wall anchor domain-containing protein n=1 Tax=Shimazuella kribbensis TaxID=139808 RepID=UPI0003FFC3FE|nr:LPXTG cell wall anchor domain-containing protein [Shimazuella kribbensis]
MKKRISMFLSWALLLSILLLNNPVSLFAEEAKGEEKTASEPVLTINYQNVNGKHKVSGKIKNGKQVKGTWLIGIGPEGSEPFAGFKYIKENATDLSVSHTFDKELRPGQHVAFVKFNGEIDGKNQALFANAPVTSKPSENPEKPVLTISHENVSGKHKVSGTIKNGKQAKGTWIIGIGPEGSEPFAGFKYIKENATDLSVSHTFDKQLRPGQHVAFVKFTGKIDGKDATLFANAPVTSKPSENPEKPALTISYENVSGKHKVSGAIKNGKQAKGTWIIGIGPEGSEPFDGFKYIKENATDLSLSHIFDKQLKPGEHVAFVKFTGKIDGKDTTLFANVPVSSKPGENPAKAALTIRVDYVNGKYKVSGTIKNGKQAKGTWLIGIGPEGSEPLAGFKYIKENTTDLSVSHTFDKQLKKGKYIAFVKFTGEIDGKVYEEKDGKNNALLARVSVEVKEVGTKPVVGGVLPKTATNYLSAVVSGVALLLVGTVLLIRRRNVTGSEM